MKISIPILNWSCGGADILIEYLIEGLMEQGHEVDPIILTASGKKLLSGVFTPTFDYKLMSWKKTEELSKLINKNDIAFYPYIANWARKDEAYINLFDKVTIPQTCMLHCSRFDKLWGKKWKNTLFKMDSIVYSRSGVTKRIDELGITHKLLKIDLPYKRMNPENKVFNKKNHIEFVGRVVPVKGHEIILSQAHTIPEWEIYVHGPIHQSRTGYLLKKQYGPLKNVHFCGEFDEEDKYNIYQNAKFACSFSKMYGGGVEYVTLEAMDMGCVPLVIPSWLGIMKENEHCIVIRKLSDFKDKLNIPDETYYTMVGNNFELIKKYDYKEATKGFVSAFTDTINNPGVMKEGIEEWI